MRTVTAICVECGMATAVVLYDDDYETAYRCTSCRAIWEEEK